MESTIPNSRGGTNLAIWVGQVLVLVVLYVVAGRLGLTLTHYHANVTLVWPPTGLSLAALILFGRRLWPGVFIGAVLVGLGTPMGWLPSAGIAIGNTLEALVGATLLVRVADFRPTLERARDGAAFLLIGVLGCTTVAATIGTASLLVSGRVEVSDVLWVWLIWWLGDGGGALILTPVLLMLARGTPSWMSLIRRPESWLVFSILITSSLFAFLGPDLGLLGFGLCAAPFPILVWAGTRLGPRGAVIASFFIITIAVIATGAGSGPFASGTATDAVLLLWAYSMFIGITAFTLAAVVEQRDLAEQRYRSGEAERLRAEKEKLLLIERERLMREMHDGLGGQIVSVLSMVERGTAAPHEVAEALRRAIDDIRIVIGSLDPDTTDLPTSLGKLRARLEPLLGRNGIELDWSIDDIPGLDSFPPETTLHVSRIIQEAVTNTLSHSNADSVDVRISCVDSGRRQLHVCIRDDGHGLPWQSPAAGRGIKNMKTRAQELGAVLEIKGTSSGLQIDLMIPFPR